VLHQRYAEFGGSLVSSLTEMFSNKENETADATVKLRSTLRLLAELYLCGFYDDSDALLAIVKGLVPTQSQEISDVQASLTLISSLAKACKEELLGKPLRAASSAADFSADVREAVTFPFRSLRPPISSGESLSSALLLLPTLMSFLLLRVRRSTGSPWIPS